MKLALVTRITAVAAVASFYVGLVTVATQEAFGSRQQGVTSLGVPTGPSTPGTGFASGADTTVDGSTGSDPSPSGDQSTPVTDPASRPVPSAGATSTSSPPRGGGGAPEENSGAAAPAAEAIQIGVHDDNPGAAFGQFGVRGSASSDQGEFIDAIVEWINANGGMGGRQVELVRHVTESLNGSFDEQAQRACSFFTEDNDVAAVVGGARVPTLNLVDCLAKHDTPLVWSYHFMADQATFDAYADYLSMPAMVSADRLGVWMDALADDGFFDGGKIGIVRYEERIAEFLSSSVLRPALARRGFEVAEEVAFRPATGASSAADLSAQANNAVLRFRSAGVDRLILEPTSAVLPLLFFASAESQSYRPRYTMTSYDLPSFQDANAPAGQLSGSVAFGWLPAGDVDWEQQPRPLPPPAQRCVDITAGADPPGNSSVRRFCDGLFFLKFLLDNGAEPTAAGIRTAVDALGSSYPSAWTYATDLGPGRHDGATTGRLVRYDDECSCYVITGNDRPIR